MQCNHDKCKMQYIGESNRSLKQRFSEHRGYVKNKITTKETGFHFNQPGHDLSKMTVTILEKVTKNDELYRKEREHFFIRKFNTYYHGINGKP